MKKQTESPEQDSRFDINRTLQSYQPSSMSSDANDAAPEQTYSRVQSADTTTQLEPEAITEKPSTKKRVLKIVKRAFIFVVIVVLLLSTVYIVWNYRNASPAAEKMFGSSSLLEAIGPSNLKNENGYTNILVIGNSADDPGHAGALLTDSIMVMSISVDKKSGYMLSIPRDLYVKIPDYGAAKINEAYQAGELQSFSESGYASGGSGLLQKTIKESLGIPIHYSVVVNYGAVKGITDALGGVSVTIASSDSRGLYDPNFKPSEGGPLKLENGTQTIDGQTALRLSRARGSTFGSYGFPLSDFNRTQNQQLVFGAIRAKLTPRLLADPRKNKPIFDAIAANVTTDIPLNGVLPLYRAFSATTPTTMKQVTLNDYQGKNYLKSFRTPSGQSALTPSAGTYDYSEIKALLKTLNP